MRTFIPPVLLLLVAMPPAQEPPPPPRPSAEALQQEFELAQRAWTYPEAIRWEPILLST